MSGSIFVTHKLTQNESINILQTVIHPEARVPGDKSNINLFVKYENDVNRIICYNPIGYGNWN